MAAPGNDRSCRNAISRGFLHFERTSTAKIAGVVLNVYKAGAECLNAWKEREKSEFGFVSQNALQLGAKRPGAGKPSPSLGFRRA
jgi:hypothetical protein